MQLVNDFSFKAFLVKQNLGSDDLLQLYMHYKEMDSLLGSYNPFLGELIAVKEILAEEFPEIWTNKL